MLTDAQIVKILADYKLAPSATQCAQIRAYISLLLRWNRSISLTSLTDELEILKFHFGESAFAVSVLGGTVGRLADVGSGAGFPGFAIRIFAPEILLTAIEPNAKKSAFLSEVAREISLDRVDVIRSRFQDIELQRRARFDFVCSRALGMRNDLLRWSTKALAPSGKIILWVGKAEADEIMRDAAWQWSPPVAIPQSQRRCILSGSPISEI